MEDRPTRCCTSRPGSLRCDLTFSLTVWFAMPPNTPVCPNRLGLRFCQRIISRNTVLRQIHRVRPPFWLRRRDSSKLDLYAGGGLLTGLGTKNTARFYKPTLGASARLIFLYRELYCSFATISILAGTLNLASLSRQYSLIRRRNAAGSSGCSRLKRATTI